MATKVNRQRTRGVKTYRVSKRLRAPNPHIEEYSIIEHGQIRTVKYGWLTDPNYGRRLLSHVKAENQYTDESFKSLGIKKKAREVAKELDGYFDTNREDIVNVDTDWSYYSVLNTSVTAASHWRFPTGSDKSESQLIFDEVAESDRIQADLVLGDIQVSDDGNLAIVTYSVDGSEKYTLQIRDIASGRIVCECDGVSVDEMCGSVSHFNKSSDGVVFIRRDASEKDAYLCYRDFSLDSKRGWVGREVRLYSEADEGVSISQTVSRDLNHILVTRNLGDATDVLVFVRNNLRKAPVKFLKNKVNFNYGVETMGDKAFIFTDYKKPEDNDSSNEGELGFYTVDISDGLLNKNASNRKIANWKSCLNLPKGVVVETYLLFSTYTVFECRVNGLPRVLVAKRDDDGVHGKLLNLGNPEALMGQELYRSSDDLSSNTFTVIEKGMAPSSIYEVTIKSFPSEDLVEHDYKCIYTNVLEGFDTSRYSGKIIESKASDGTTIPIMIWTPNHMETVGTVLNVYGAYGHTHTFGYNESFRSLLEHGVACAVAYVRGGGELGIGWHNAGRLGNKMNTITDTIAASNKIKELGLAGKSGSNIVLQGYSAGGVAVGGALNLNPKAFAGVVGEVPFVDCLATMLDPNLPLTVVEYPEWGNPSKSKRDWESIKSWSPVDNVPSDASHYPPVLATAGLGDIRVGIWEPARWVLTLRKAKAQVYLRTNVSAGHAGETNQTEGIKAQAEVISFILWCLSR